MQHVLDNFSNDLWGTISEIRYGKWKNVVKYSKFYSRHPFFVLKEMRVLEQIEYKKSVHTVSNNYKKRTKLETSIFIQKMIKQVVKEETIVSVVLKRYYNDK